MSRTIDQILSTIFHSPPSSNSCSSASLTSLSPSSSSSSYSPFSFVQRRIEWTIDRKRRELPQYRFTVSAVLWCHSSSSHRCQDSNPWSDTLAGIHCTSWIASWPHQSVSKIIFPLIISHIHTLSWLYWSVFFYN